MSVCLSQVGVVQRWLNLGSHWQCCTMYHTKCNKQKQCHTSHINYLDSVTTQIWPGSNSQLPGSGTQRNSLPVPPLYTVSSHDTGCHRASGGQFLTPHFLALIFDPSRSSKVKCDGANQKLNYYVQVVAVSLYADHATQPTIFEIFQVKILTLTF